MKDSTEYTLFGAIDILESVLNKIWAYECANLPDKIRHAKDQIHAAIMDERKSINCNTCMNNRFVKWQKPSGIFIDIPCPSCNQDVPIIPWR